MTDMDREFELALVLRLREADDGAFDVVHAAFNARLFNFLARLSRRRDVAEDLLEETWLRFIDRAPAMRDDTRLAPLLFTIARNLYVSYCRSRSIEDHHAPALLGMWPAAAAQPSPFDLTVASETRLRVDQALASLPATYREALLLVGVENLKPAEAAAVCGVSADAMRQRISRARAMLARALEAHELSHLLTLKEVTT